MGRDVFVKGFMRLSVPLSALDLTGAFKELKVWEKAYPLTLVVYMTTLSFIKKLKADG